MAGWCVGGGWFGVLACGVVGAWLLSAEVSGVWVVASYFEPDLLCRSSY